MADRSSLRFVVVWAARIITAVVFVWAAIPKIINLPGFATDIANFQVFPSFSVNILAALVPMVELVGAIAIITGWKRRAAAWMLGLLDVAFIALIVWVIAAGIDISCGCFGQDEEAARLGWPQFWRDVALLAAIVVAAWESGPWPWTRRPTS